MSTTPVFAPDGTLGDIPTQNVSAALKAGGTMGVEMTAPDGTPGVVPMDKVHEAIKAGGMLKGAAPPAGSGISLTQTPYPVQANLQAAGSAFLERRAQAQRATEQMADIVHPQPTRPAFSLAPVQQIGQDIKGTFAEPTTPESSAAWARTGYDLLPFALLGKGGKSPEMIPTSEGDIPARAFGQGVYEKYIPPETQANKLAQIIQPPKAEIPNLGQALATETGNVKAFAKATGNPLQNGTDFAQAARGAGYETQRYFTNKFVDPIADEQVSVAGTGYQGRTVGEGQRATVADINARIGELNRLMSADYIKRRATQVGAAVEQDADLKAEHDALVNVLHDTIQRKLGVDPADTQAVRSRMGRLYSIADQTQAAVNDRVSAFTSRKYGMKLPESGTQAGFQILNRLVGGPEAKYSAASRALRKGLGSTTIPASQLPIPSPFEAPSQPPRSPAWLNAPVSQPVPSILEQGTVTPSDVAARATAMQERMAQTRAAQQTAAEQAAEQATTTPQGLARARSLQEQAAQQRALRNALRRK